MNNKVTIVIPTFNRSKYVCDTIDGAISQTIPCDIIVCDHGSSDNTPEVVRKYGNKIQYIRRERDFGPNFCWLEGVLNAKTDIIHIHFDDDLLAPTYIEETMNYMSDDVGMVFTNANYINRETNVLYDNPVLPIPEDWQTGILKTSSLEKKLLHCFMISPSACLFHKKEVVDAILSGNLPIDFGGGYHGVGADLMMSLLVCLRYEKCVFIKKNLVSFGIHNESITVNAGKNPERKKMFYDAYDSYRVYYQLLRLYKDNSYIRRKVSLKPSLLRRCYLIVKKLGNLLCGSSKKEFEDV